MAKKTKDLIVDSFLSLVARDDVIAEKISITDIVEECNISRQTFYYHFKDITEMLEWAFEHETQMIEKEIPKYENYQDALLLYENFFKKFGIFLKKTLNSKIFVQVYSIVFDSFSSFTKTFFATKRKSTDDDKFNFAVDIYAYSFIGFLIRELKKDNPDFPMMIRRIHNNLSNQ